jgi:hypothetical protein
MLCWRVDVVVEEGTMEDQFELDYIHAMGFVDAPGDANKCARRRALARSHEIRKFEIELYWKRATYFFALQAAVFTGFGFASTQASTAPNTSSNHEPILAIMLACLGLLTALAGHLSARGSKFWMENWERHIDELESPFEGALHKAVWRKKGFTERSFERSWSVSRLNQQLTLGFIMLWIGALWKALSAAGNFAFPCANPDGILSAQIAVVLGLAAWLAVRLWNQETEFKGESKVEREIDETRWQLWVRK